ncbi:MAG: PHP domain-containing protein [Gammaproteobacteria bacterium]|nr:PHP domain-containing protein [Gammaproteobacteria bacterium]NND54796.1 PHP domain-containing protein [Gammaproteobacteria bacterium]
MQIDLHTHSTESDGALSPTQLVHDAHAAGVSVIALTDHDTVAGLDEGAAALPDGLTLIPGIELSATWRNCGVHIVGLNIDPDNPALRSGIARQHHTRLKRADTIASRLEKSGFTNVLSGAQQEAGREVVCRPHFARYLVRSGQIKDERTAFKKHLGRGTRGDVREGWPDMATVVEWIHAAGGAAVLAHPAKYKLTNLRLEELCRAFVEASGDAIEVISGFQHIPLTDKLARLANRHGLLASTGSDFHKPGQAWAQLGKVPPLPSDSRPVWEHW